MGFLRLSSVDNDGAFLLSIPLRISVNKCLSFVLNANMVEIKVCMSLLSAQPFVTIKSASNRTI